VCGDYAADIVVATQAARNVASGARSVQ